MKALRRAAALAALGSILLLAVPEGTRRSPPSSLRFAGRRWIVAGRAEPQGPGPNVFDAGNVGLDAAGRLSLETAWRGGRWTCAQLFLAKSLGYGSYELDLAAPETGLDPLAVLGFYTWDEDPAFANRELDIELSSWGEDEGPNLQFVVQPLQAGAGRRARFRLDLSKPIRLRLDWRPGSARFSARSGEAEESWEFPQPGSGEPEPFGVPTPGRARIGLNLWLMDGGQPRRADRVVVEDFRFAPWKARRR